MEITVNIKCPDLALAASTLAQALQGAAPTTAPVTPPAAAVNAPGPAPVATPVPPAAAQAPASVPPSNAFPAAVSATGPAPAAPVAPAPQITLAQMGKAGADLVAKNPAVMPQLAALLQKYGVQAVQQIKPEQIGAFATDLRGLGAVI